MEVFLLFGKSSISVGDLILVKSNVDGQLGISITSNVMQSSTVISSNTSVDLNAVCRCFLRYLQNLCISVERNRKNRIVGSVVAIVTKNVTIAFSSIFGTVWLMKKKICIIRLDCSGTTHRELIGHWKERHGSLCSNEYKTWKDN